MAAGLLQRRSDTGIEFGGELGGVTIEVRLSASLAVAVEPNSLAQHKTFTTWSLPVLRILTLMPPFFCL